MFTKTAIALAIILGTASGTLAATKKQHSTNPTWDVYDGRGVYLGSDPDPRIRSMLLHDQGNGSE
jgi:hypothetical protein